MSKFKNSLIKQSKVLQKIKLSNGMILFQKIIESLTIGLQKRNNCFKKCLVSRLKIWGKNFPLGQMSKKIQSSTNALKKLDSISQKISNRLNQRHIKEKY